MGYGHFVGVMLPITASLWFPSLALLLIVLSVVIYISRYLRKISFLLSSDLEVVAALASNELMHFDELRGVKNRISETVDRLKNVEKKAAVAQVTQMLAHDVRKPFTMLKVGIGMLAESKDPKSVQEVIGVLIPELEKAIHGVDGLISDVMEFGSDSYTLVRERLDAKGLAEKATREVQVLFPKAKISFKLDINHTNHVYANELKLSRVFSNILTNAVEAAGPSGEVWVRTHDIDGFVEFCIGNSGSFIEPESLDRIFDAFYTAGKPGGTGLGLAIAHKVVKEHGGDIWCRSKKIPDNPEGTVEFHFTVPISP